MVHRALFLLERSQDSLCKATLDGKAARSIAAAEPFVTAPQGCSPRLDDHVPELDFQHFHSRV